MSMSEKVLRELAAENHADAIRHDECTATADSMTANPLKWVDYLPEVGDPILRKRSDIGRLLDRAADLEAMAKQLREQASRTGAELEARCAELWESSAITAAKTRAAAQVAGL